MRTKTRALPAKYSKPPSPPPFVASSAFRRLDFVDEGNAERDYVPDTYTDCTIDELSKKDAQAMGPNNIPEANGLLRNSIHGGSQDSADLLGVQMKVCLRCGKRGQLLVCSEAGCPVAIHKKCLDRKPKYDEAGNYFCPHCLYKRATQKVQMLRRKAMLAKQALSNFLGGRVGGGLKKVQKDGSTDRKQASSSPSGNQNQGNDGIAVENYGGDRRKRNEVLPATEKCDGAEDQMDWSASSAHNQDEGSGRGVQEDDLLAVVDQPPQETSNTCRELIVFQSEENRESSNTCRELIVFRGGENQETSNSCRELIVRESGQRQETTGAFHGNEKTRRKKHKQHQTREATKLTTKVAEIEKSESDAGASLLNSNASIMKKQQGGAHHENVDPPEEGCSRPSIYSRSPQAKEPRARGQIMIKKDTKIAVACTTARRARLEWTIEEEAMLKEGVQKYKNIINKNIPWKRILEDGSHVFNSARRPSDLKDKWKNMERLAGSVKQ